MTASVAPAPAPASSRAASRRATRSGRRIGWIAVSVVAAAAVVAPVVFLVVSVLDPQVDLWRQQWQTRLPGQLRDTFLLLGGVAACTLVLGAGLGWLVTVYRFPGSQVLAWLLIAPLAMPSYVLGFVTLSVFGFTGPIQTWWRDVFGDGAWFPEVRSVGGAVVVFSLVLYPYVFVMTRAALHGRAGAAYDAARSLGATPSRAARRVVLPLIRPALAAGVGIVMMETLTDFATVQYFDVDTVSVGVFRIWRGRFDRDAASEFATLVLVVALLVIGVERLLRGRARYHDPSSGRHRIEPTRLTGVGAWAATLGCLSVLLLAFAAPVLRLATWAIAEARGDRGTPLLDRFVEYLGNSVLLAATTAGICVVVAVLVTNATRFAPGRATSWSARLTAVGYAVPGPVVAIGVVLALVALDDVLGVVGLGLPGIVATGSMVGLVYAYTIRFLAPGLNAVESGLAQVAPDVTASARSLGERPFGVLRRVHVPMMRSSMLTAAVLVAVDALKELPIVLLLRPLGFDTLSVWTFGLATESRYEQAALPALTIIAVALVPVAILSRRLSAPAGGRS